MKVWSVCCTHSVWFGSKVSRRVNRFFNDAFAFSLCANIMFIISFLDHLRTTHASCESREYKIKLTRPITLYINIYDTLFLFSLLSIK